MLSDAAKTPNQHWMEVVERQTRAKVTRVNELDISENDIEKGIEKKKNWAMSGMTGIENFWWKIFNVCLKHLSTWMNA